MCLLFFREAVYSHCWQNDQNQQSDLHQCIRPEIVDQGLEFQDSVNQQDKEGEPADSKYSCELELSFLQFHNIFDISASLQIIKSNQVS